MRLLLDECVPKALGREFSDHEVVTAPQAGWAGLQNGELLARAAAEFDASIPTDRGLEHQQDLALYDIAIVLLLGRSNDIDDLRPLAPRALGVLSSARAGEVTRVTV